MEPPAGPWMAPFDPDRVNRYERVRKIGSGAFGEVFLCRDVFTGHLVATKAVRVGAAQSSYGRPPPGVSKEPELPRPLFRELHSLRFLGGHPNVVSLVDAYPRDTELVLVLLLRLLPRV